MYRLAFRKGTGRANSYIVSLSICAGAFALIPTQVAFQDTLSRLTGENGGGRSQVYMLAPEGSSTHAQTFAFKDRVVAKGARKARRVVRKIALVDPTYTGHSEEIDPIITGSIGKIDGAGEIGFGDVSLSATREIVMGARKGDRLITVTHAPKPQDFAAGSVYRMTSLLSDNGVADMPRVAFVKSRPLPGMTRTAHADRNDPDAATGAPMVLDPQMILAHRAAAVSASLVTAYAPEIAGELNSPFAALLGHPVAPETPVAVPPTTPPAARGTHWWAKSALPLSVHKKKEKACLARAIYFEARGEPVNGQVAVAQVVLNRVKNPTYPNTICKVVYQNKRWRNRCQFSFACDGVRDRIRNQRLWKLAKTLASDVVAGRRWIKDVGASTHYHATYVRPRWARRMKRQERIGRHIFYRTYRGGWS